VTPLAQVSVASNSDGVVKPPGIGSVSARALMPVGPSNPIAQRAESL
jgi:hypothetical protein